MAEGSEDRLLARLEQAADAIVRAQRRRLLRRYGDGRWRYHDMWRHMREVEVGAVEGARRLVAAGVLPPESPADARIAAAFHDDIQLDEHAAKEYPAVAVHSASPASGPSALQLSPQREELSAEVALKAMDDYNSQRGEEIFSESDRAMVKEMIEATKVLGGTPTGLVQNTSAGRPAGALMADADLSSLGRHDYALRALDLHFENEWLQGLHVAPAYGDIRQWEPDHGRTVEFMSKQQGLVGGHRYLLEQSREMFPNQALNAKRMGGMRDDYAAGRLSWAGAVDLAREWARAERTFRQVREVRPRRPHLHPEPRLGDRAVKVASRDTDRTR